MQKAYLIVLVIALSLSHDYRAYTQESADSTTVTYRAEISLSKMGSPGNQVSSTANTTLTKGDAMAEQIISNAADGLIVTSSSIKDGESIPSKQAGGGPNLSPALSWKGAPPETRSYAIIMDDPDAPGGTWVHWVVYNIPAVVSALPENAGASGGKSLPLGAKHGRNSWHEHRLGPGDYYQGPQPPPGKPHRYFIKLYALDISSLELPSTHPTKKELETAMTKHILATGTLMGTYSTARSRP